MTIKKGSFWDFEPCSKQDVLYERRHTHVVCAAIEDEDTCAEEVYNGWILYGPEEALLVETPRNFGLRLALSLLAGLTTLFCRN